MSANHVITPRTGRTFRPPRVLIYGPPKVGKTTFASGARDVVLIGPEDGAEDLDVAKLPTPESWEEVIEQVRWLAEDEHGFQAVALDTLDWLEPLLWRFVCTMGKKDTIEDFGFGKGYELAVDHWRGLLRRLEQARGRGMTIIALAHAHVRAFQNPNGPDYDRWEMKIHKKAAGLWQEWVDVIGFASVASTVSKDGKAKTDGKRLLYTQDAAAFVAGSRYIIPNPLPLDWPTFAVEVKKAFDSKSKEGKAA